MQLNEIVIQSALLVRYAGQLSHAFCTRRGGISDSCYSSLNFSHQEGDLPQNVEANKEVVAKYFQIDASSFYMVRQTHGAEILVVGTEGMVGGSGALEYDGLLTARPGVALCIKTADCLPVLLFEPKARVVGAIHAGWRGTALNIVGKAVEIMVEKFGAERSAIIAAIGPAIGACCYEVDETVRRRLSEWQECFLPAHCSGRWMLDIKEANRRQLLGAGLQAVNLEVNPLCTACEARLFFSHRRDKGKTGRMLNFIALKDDV